MAFMAMKLLGIGSNIMSLGGIAIAIGAMIDAAIVMIENAHKHLERAPPGKPRTRDPDRSRSRGRPGAVLLAAHHHGVVPADLHAGSAGRAAVRPAGLHQDLRHGGGGRALGDAGAGADDASSCAAASFPKRKNPLNRALIAIYRPVIRAVLQGQDADHRACGGRSLRYRCGR